MCGYGFNQIKASPVVFRVTFDGLGKQTNGLCVLTLLNKSNPFFWSEEKEMTDKTA